MNVMETEPVRFERPRFNEIERTFEFVIALRFQTSLMETTSLLAY